MSSSLSSDIVPPSRGRRLSGFPGFLSHHRIEGFLVLLLLALNLFFSLVYLGPSYQGLADEEQSLQGSRSRISQLLQYRKAEAGLEEVQTSFIKQQELAQLVKLFPDLAKRYKLSLPEVNYQIERGGREHFKRISLSFNLVGRYDNIRRFIHETERLNLFLYIEDLSIAGSSRNPQNLTMEIRMVAHLG